MTKRLIWISDISEYWELTLMKTEMLEKLFSKHNALALSAEIYADGDTPKYAVKSQTK